MSAEDLIGGKHIVVTGGLGSIGSVIVQEVLKFQPRLVTVVDNRETAMFYAIWGNGDPRVRYVFADVRDRDSIERVIRGADIVFHAAAMKHVLVCERNPAEAEATNVRGTQNVVDACLKNGVKRMVLISTDKATNPTNVLGATKLRAEQIVAGASGNGDTVFGVVRFGNVLYSQGSVLEIWKRQLERKEKIQITDPSMTRFFMSIPQSVQLILTAARMARGGEVFILKMPSCAIGTLAEAFLELNGYPPDYYTKIGVREGEKVHEELLFKEEAALLLENDTLLLRLPVGSPKDRFADYTSEGFQHSGRTNYLSNDPTTLLSKEEVKDILRQYLQGKD